jgi:uncharacterized protein YdhG (YjbR/CyaY superfamily)
MRSTAASPEEYIAQLPQDRKEVFVRLRSVILKNLPEGFSEGINYGMICYFVPHSRYPQGYHCNPKLPLPFMSLASQKNSINVYHSGIYTDKNLYNWWVKSYTKHATARLDMGKSCIRFKKKDAIPFELIGSLCRKISVKQWIALYERCLKK